MTDNDTRPGASVEVEASSSMLRSESTYLDTTLGALVDRLTNIPGLEIDVSYHHGRLRRLIGDIPYLNDLHRRTDRVEKIVVSMGTFSYWLDAGDGLVKCGTDVVSIERGKVTESLTFPAWASRLFDDIAGQNLVNHQSMAALRHLIEADRI